MNLRALLTTALAAGAVIAGNLALIEPAHAYVGLQRVSADTPSDSSSPKTIKATCPNGKVVIGGGGQVTGGLGNVVLNVLRPVATENAYQVIAAEDNAGYMPSWRLRAYVICAWSTEVGAVEYKRVNTPDTATTATCSAGKKVIGVGGEVNGASPEAILEDVVPNATLTAVTTRTYPDPTSVVTWSNIAWAICANPIPGLVRHESGPTATTDQDACPAGTKSHGAGYEITAAGIQHGEVVLDELVPMSSVTNSFATAYEDKHNPPNGWTVNTYSICAT